jgi:hypothetical protein
MLGPTSSVQAQGQTSKKLVAYYYAWYDRTTWQAGITPDVPARLYDSADATTMQRQIVQAQRSGIDAFNVAWLGPGNPTDRNIGLLLENAELLNFEVSVGFETDGPFFHTRDDVIAALRYAVASYTERPAYLRYDGKPVLFFWRLPAVPLGDVATPLDAWAAIRAAVDPHHDVLWIGEGDRFEYLRVFDGIHPYSVAWAPNVRSTLVSYGNSVRQQSATLRTRKLWVATVMPGYDDTRTGRTDAFARARNGADFYQETWTGAVASNPDMIMITSWNEWVEGSQVEPSQTYGELYLNVTRRLSTQWKGPPREPPPAALALVEDEARFEDCDVPGKIRGAPAVRLASGSLLETGEITTRATVPIRREPSERAPVAGAWAEEETLTTHFFLPGKRANGSPVTWRLVLGPGEECGWVAFGVDGLAGAEAGDPSGPAVVELPEWLIRIGQDLLGWDGAEVEVAINHARGLLPGDESPIWPIAAVVLIVLLLRLAIRR